MPKLATRLAGRILSGRQHKKSNPHYHAFSNAHPLQEFSPRKFSLEEIRGGGLMQSANAGHKRALSPGEVFVVERREVDRVTGKPNNQGFALQANDTDLLPDVALQDRSDFHTFYQVSPTGRSYNAVGGRHTDQNFYFGDPNNRKRIEVSRGRRKTIWNTSPRFGIGDVVEINPNSHLKIDPDLSDL